MAWTGAILFSSVVLLLFRESCCDFPNDYLGNYLTDEEYNNRTFCKTLVCMKDSGRLIYAANYSLNRPAPCDDFKTFAMGNFFEHRVVSERYPYVGFHADVQEQFFEKQKRMLLKPIEQGDPKMFKVTKRFFRLCVNSSLVRDQGTRDVIAYMRHLGILQLSPEDDAERLDVKTAMASQSNWPTALFFDHIVTYCKTNLREMLCLYENPDWTVSDIFEFTEILDSLRSLKIDASYKDRMAKDFVSYLEMKKPIQDKFSSNSGNSVIVKFKDLYEKYPSKHLDWLQMINNHLLSDSQQTLDDEILIQNPQLMEGLHRLFAEIDEPFLANVFATAFLTRTSTFYETYSFTREEAREFGTNRAYQRFEQCLGVLRTILRPALEAMKAVTFYDESVQKSATELVELAVAEAIQVISKIEEIDNETKDIITEKLKSAKLWVMFPDEILNATKVDELYKELDFEGSESMVELSLKIEKHNWKLKIMPKDDWTNLFYAITNKENNPTYFPNENILNFPVMWTLYPFFHPNRSRFFNTATLYKSAVNVINEGLSKAWPSIALSRALNAEVMADQSYVRWEANGGVDLQLPSFKLSNRQMLWVCLANMNSLKFHKNRPKENHEESQFLNEFLHPYFKLFPGFREAFQCGDTFTVEEENQLAEMKARAQAYYQKKVGF